MIFHTKCSFYKCTVLFLKLLSGRCYILRGTQCKKRMVVFPLLTFFFFLQYCNCKMHVSLLKESFEFSFCNVQTFRRGTNTSINLFILIKNTCNKPLEFSCALFVSQKRCRYIRTGFFLKIFRNSFCG